jgi:hypothetical protein
VPADAHDVASWRNKGISLCALGQVDEAIACFDRVLALEPLGAANWYNKGSALYELGRYKEAWGCFEEAAISALKSLKESCEVALFTDSEYLRGGIAAWRTAALNRHIVTIAGRRVRPNCYHYFVSVNTQRADLGLPQFDLPPAEPVLSPNPVAELVITNAGAKITLKLRVPGQPAQYTLVQAAAPVRSGVRCVQHFTFLGLLPPPKDGWSDITELYVGRYGVPKVGTAVWIRTCQHIDGWTDVPKVTRARVPAATP